MFRFDTRKYNVILLDNLNMLFELIAHKALQPYCVENFKSP